MNCKFCQSPNTIKYGYRSETHYYKCKDCGRKFSGKMAPENMHFSKKIINESIDLFYYGIPLRDISRHILISEKTYVDPSSIWRWILRFSRKAEQILNNVNIGHSQRWIVCENKIKNGSRTWLIIDVLDFTTRFLLASLVTANRSLEQIKELFLIAHSRTNNTPIQVVTNRYAVYSEVVEQVFGANTEHIKHIKGKGIRSDIDTHIIRLFQRTTQGRTDILGRLRTPESVKVIAQGYTFYYNFMCPLKELGNLTPSMKVGLNDIFDNWIKVMDHYLEV